VASKAALSKNCTVPVGVLPPAETVAVKVTVCPHVEGLLEDATVTAVANNTGSSTIWVKTGDTLASKRSSPV
jgi:hypothetical protein